MTYPWSSEFETGNWVIDDQHRHLLELAGLLSRTVESAPFGSATAEALSALERYVRFHTGEEEAFLAAIAAPSLARHRRLHASIAMEIEALRFRMESGAGDIGLRLARWVRASLVPHFVRDDAAALAETRRRGSARRVEAVQTLGS